MTLLERKKKTDREEKFDAIYGLYGQLMYRIAYRILEDKQDAEDAVSESLEKIFRNIDKIIGVDCPQTRGYIVTIIRNTSYTVYRKRKKFQRGGVEDAMRLRGELCEGTLKGCLDRLSERNRRVIILHYHYGYSMKEIGQIMGVSVEAAKKMCQRAKAELAELCKEEALL